MLAALAIQPMMAGPVTAEPAPKSAKNPVPLPPPPVAAPAPLETRPYDPQLLRLAEILGALTYLRGVCGAQDVDQWRARMQALLDAEGVPQSRKERLAGAYNHGIEGYSFAYRTCTTNARILIDRFLKEGAGIAKEVENRYRAS